MPLVNEIDLMIGEIRNTIEHLESPTGSRESPPMSCKDLTRCRNITKDGFYWIDPNTGSPKDSIRAFCNFTAMTTCVYPTKPTIEIKKWVSGENGHNNAGKIDYNADELQLMMLQLLSNRVEQHFTLDCTNTVAWNEKSIKLIGANEYAFGAMTSERPTVLRDDCKAKGKEGKLRKSIFRVATKKTSRLPFSDFEVSDLQGEFSAEIGPVCFYT